MTFPTKNMCFATGDRCSSRKLSDVLLQTAEFRLSWKSCFFSNPCLNFSTFMLVNLVFSKLPFWSKKHHRHQTYSDDILCFPLTETHFGEIKLDAKECIVNFVVFRDFPLKILPCLEPGVIHFILPLFEPSPPPGQTLCNTRALETNAGYRIWHRGFQFAIS